MPYLTLRSVTRPIHPHPSRLRFEEWIDIEQVLFLTAAELDVAELTTWVNRLVGRDDRRATRLRDLISAIVVS